MTDENKLHIGFIAGLVAVFARLIVLMCLTLKHVILKKKIYLFKSKNVFKLFLYYYIIFSKLYKSLSSLKQFSAYYNKFAIKNMKFI